MLGLRDRDTCHNFRECREIYLLDQVYKKGNVQIGEENIIFGFGQFLANWEAPTL